MTTPVRIKCGGMALLAALAVSGCSEPASIYAPPDQCHQIEKDIPVEINRNIDILLVMDTSSSMATEQATIARNLRRFVAVLENLGGGVPNFHLGVISSDLGAGAYGISGCTGDGGGGALQSTPRVAGCSPPNGAFISDVALRDGTRDRNFGGDLADTLSCIAELGAGGCDRPQPLEAMRRALDGSNPANDGFLREDAFLMVVFITDSDDCSATDTSLFDPGNASLGPSSEFRCFEHGVVCAPDAPRTPGAKSECVPRPTPALLRDVDEYVRFLKGRTSDPAMILVSTISGGPGPVIVSASNGAGFTLDDACGSADGEATPSVRLSYFLEQFPQRNVATSVCAEDYSDALSELATLQATILGVPCIEGSLDIDPVTAGIQYDCVVSDVRRDGDQLVEEIILDECPPDGPVAGDFPCWWIEHDPRVCPDTETGTILRVERSSATVPPNTYTQLRCLGLCDIVPE